MSVYKLKRGGFLTPSIAAQHPCTFAYAYWFLSGEWRRTKNGPYYAKLWQMRTTTKISEYASRHAQKSRSYHARLWMYMHIRVTSYEIREYIPILHSANKLKRILILDARLNYFKSNLFKWAKKKCDIKLRIDIVIFVRFSRAQRATNHILINSSAHISFLRSSSGFFALLLLGYWLG